LLSWFKNRRDRRSLIWEVLMLQRLPWHEYIEELTGDRSLTLKKKGLGGLVFSDIESRVRDWEELGKEIGAVDVPESPCPRFLCSVRLDFQRPS
jgi:hypothetical protein